MMGVSQRYSKRSGQRPAGGESGLLRGCQTLADRPRFPSASPVSEHMYITLFPVLSAMSVAAIFQEDFF